MTYNPTCRLIEAKPPPRRIVLDNTYSKDRKQFIYEYRAQQEQVKRLFQDAAMALSNQLLASSNADGTITPTQANLLRINQELMAVWETFFKGDSAVLTQNIVASMQSSVENGGNFALQEVVHSAGLPVQSLPTVAISTDLAISLARGDIDTRFIYTGTGGIKLSDLVWQDGQRDFNRIMQSIRSQVLIGTDAATVAKSLMKFINGENVFGYTPWKSALRIARTEMAQAFHAGQLEEYNQLDFVEAVKWNLSLSHRPSGCACEKWATQDLYQLGRGVYPKNAVPAIPHPQCLCFLTAVVSKDVLKTIFGE